MLAGGGFQRAVGPAGRVGCERRRSLEKRSGRRESTSRAGALGGLLQLEGDLLIGLHDRVRTVPRATIRVEIAVGGGRQRPMGGMPLVRRRCAIDRRTQQRVTKRDLRSELQQSVGFRRRQLVHGDTGLLRGAKEQRRLTRRIGCGHDEQTLRRSGSCRTRRRKLASIRPGNDPSPASANPPASPWENSRGSSSSASGLPRASASIRSRTLSSRRVVMTDASNARAETSGSPSSRNSDSPLSSSTPPARARRTAGQPNRPPRRRATNASTCAEDRSSH